MGAVMASPHVQMHPCGHLQGPMGFFASPEISYLQAPECAGWMREPGAPLEGPPGEFAPARALPLEHLEVVTPSFPDLEESQHESWISS